MNSQRNTAEIIGNKTDLVLLLLSFYTKNFTPVGSNSNGNDVVVCILNICYMLCSISLVNWTTCKQIAEIEKKLDVTLFILCPKMKRGFITILMRNYFLIIVTWILAVSEW